MIINIKNNNSHNVYNTANVCTGIGKDFSYLSQGTFGIWLKIFLINVELFKDYYFTTDSMVIRWISK